MLVIEKESQLQDNCKMEKNHELPVGKQTPWKISKLEKFNKKLEMIFTNVHVQNLIASKRLLSSKMVVKGVSIT